MQDFHQLNVWKKAFMVSFCACTKLPMIFRQVRTSVWFSICGAALLSSHAASRTVPGAILTWSFRPNGRRRVRRATISNTTCC